VGGRTKAVTNMYIFQPDRILLKQQIASVAHYVRGKVLDIGAGHFDRYSRLFTYDSYTKTDITPHSNVELVCTAYDIPMPDSSYDSVVCTQVYEHLADPVMAAREMYRVLKPGGFAVVTVPQMNEIHEAPHDYYRYTKFGLGALFSGAGFEIVEMLQRGGHYATLAQMKIVRWNEVFNLYDRPLLGRVAGKIIFVYGSWMLMLDRWFPSKTQTIGWCVVLKK
jgi:SAM-dependent methyltransferase